MSSSFNPVNICRDLAKPLSTGHLQVSHQGVTWTVALVQGRLQYAVHSIQSLETLEYHLLKLGFDQAVQAVRTITQADLEQLSSQEDASRSGWLSKATQWLFARGVVNEAQISTLTMALSQDALESMLWLTNGTWSWNLSESTSGFHPDACDWPEFADVIDALEQRREAWQRLRPLIISPYQQPYCQNIALLNQAVPGGMLSTEMLSTLVKLMQGTSLRKLSIFLRQDVLKVAQLLYPYFAHRVLQLRPPNAPVNQLPPIPVNAGEGNAVRVGSSIASVARESDAATPVATRQKIICIDDSPAMLETIERYLGAANFEVITVENPMESLTVLFDMKPDLILMDVSMPGINGNRLCQILRRSAIFKEVPIVMVSGNSGVLDKAKAQASGATDYLTKPFSREDLLAIVDNHLVQQSSPVT